MPERSCVKCSRALEGAEGRGRPARYCSKGCRRAAEYELRRIQRHIETAEQWIHVLSGATEGLDKRRLDQWTETRERLEERLRELLEEADE